VKKVNIAKNISDLRRKKGVTQEQMASALNVSAQAVSKWETDTCLPDTQTMPLIADYFGVSVDYLYYGSDMTYDDIYEKVFEKIKAHRVQMSADAFEDTLKIFGCAHHGISWGNLRSRDMTIYDEVAHISGENGVSVITGRGFGALVTRRFFENIDRETADFAVPVLAALSDVDRILVCMAIISMSDISFGELEEKLGFDDDRLRAALDGLIDAKLVKETKSKHKSLGFTYEIMGMYHSCLCIVLASLEMCRMGLSEGVSCCMGFGDFPIRL